MKVSAFYDVVCPWCFIGHKHLVNAMSAYPADKLQVEWRPFQLAPDMEKEITKDAYYRMRGMDPAVMEKGQARLTELAKPLGITFNHGRATHIFNTLDAHRLMAFAPAEKKPALLAALYEGYFTHGLNYARAADLASVAEKVGLGPASAVVRFLESPELADVVTAQVKEAYTMPIITVPYIVVNDRFPVQFTHMEGVAEFALRNLWE